MFLLSLTTILVVNPGGLLYSVHKKKDVGANISSAIRESQTRYASTGSSVTHGSQMSTLNEIKARVARQESMASQQSSVVPDKSSVVDGQDDLDNDPVAAN